MFKFIKSEVELENGGGVTVASLLDIEDTDNYQAAFLGRCMTLFGEPFCVTDDYEALYSYYIKAVAEGGEEIPLEIYFGSGGPSIAVMDGDKGNLAAMELAKTIMKAAPMDCRIESVYNDVPVTIIMGVENGEPFYKSLFPGMSEDMTEEEMMEFMEDSFDNKL